MHACSIALVAAALGVNSGWQPLEDGGMEYIVQIQPDLIESMQAGEVLTSIIPAGVNSVRSFKIVVGNERPPRIDPPVLSIDDAAKAEQAARERTNVLRTNSLRTADDDSTKIAQYNANPTFVTPHPRAQERYGIPQNIAPLNSPAPAANGPLMLNPNQYSEPAQNDILTRSLSPTTSNSNAATVPFRIDQQQSTTRQPVTNQQEFTSRQPIAQQPSLQDQRQYASQQQYTSQQSLADQQLRNTQQVPANDSRYQQPTVDQRYAPETPNTQQDYRNVPQRNTLVDDRYDSRLDEMNRTVANQYNQVQETAAKAQDMLRDVEPLRSGVNNTTFRNTSNLSVPAATNPAPPISIPAANSGVSSPHVPGTAETNPPALSIGNNGNNSDTQRKSQDDGIGAWGMLIVLLFGSIIGNFYLGFTWLATRRRFFSLIRDRKLAM